MSTTLVSESTDDLRRRRWQVQIEIAQAVDRLNNRIREHFEISRELDRRHQELWGGLKGHGGPGKPTVEQPARRTTDVE